MPENFSKYNSKIAIVGAHSVGKTTLAKSLADKIGATYIHDIVREEAVPKGFEINENTPFEADGIRSADREFQIFYKKEGLCLA